MCDCRYLLSVLWLQKEAAQTALISNNMNVDNAIGEIIYLLHNQLFYYDVPFVYTTVYTGIQADPCKFVSKW